MKVKQLLITLIMGSCALIFCYHAFAEAYKHYQKRSQGSHLISFPSTPISKVKHLIRSRL